MTAPSLADRILAALAEDPMSEADFRVTFPKVSLEAIRTKLAELQQAGQIVQRDGVYRIPPGGSVSPEALAKVAAAKQTAAEEDTRKATVAVTTAAIQRRAAPARPREVVEPARVKDCIRCEETKPTSEFAKMAKSKDGLYPYCRECTREYRKSRLKPADAPRKVTLKPKTPAPKRKVTHVSTQTPVPQVEQALVAVRRTWTLSLRDVHGIVREITLDDATRAAALQALST